MLATFRIKSLFRAMKPCTLLRKRRISLLSIILIVCFYAFAKHAMYGIFTKVVRKVQGNQRRIPEVGTVAAVVNINNNTYTIRDWLGISPSEANAILANRWNVDIALKYDNFSIAEPNFISTKERTLFFQTERNRNDVGPVAENKLVGRIKLITNGSVHAMYDCGWSNDIAKYEKYIPSAMRIDVSNAILCPILVPDGGYFQHFLDGVVPKLIQVMPLLRTKRIKLLLFATKDKIILEILRAWNISEDHVISYTNGYVSSLHSINTCQTPPLHPLLWQKAQSILRNRETISYHSHQPPSYGSVILLTRAKSRNGKRRIENRVQVEKFLNARYPSRLKIFAGSYNLTETMSLFADASIVIGVHGGAFYNIMWCRPGTVVVEVMPTKDDGKVMAAAHTIFWQMAGLLNMTYWRISQPPIEESGNVHIPLSKLKKLFNKIG